MGTKVDFGAARKDAEAQGLVGGGDYFKFQEGGNRIRLASECLPHADTYQGRKNFRWLCYVIDRRDAKVKPFFMPHAIYKQIEALQVSEDYGFAEVPMPYDLMINAANAGTKEVRYTVIPAKKETPVTALEHQQIAEQKPLRDLQQKLREKKNAGTAEEHEHGEPVAAEDIPF